jgi:hypothetical protein
MAAQHHLAAGNGARVHDWLHHGRVSVIDVPSKYRGGLVVSEARRKVNELLITIHPLLVLGIGADSPL